MRPTWTRIAGAAAFALLVAVLVAFGPLLQGDGVDAPGLFWELLTGAVVGYLVWPGLEFA